MKQIIFLSLLIIAVTACKTKNSNNQEKEEVMIDNILLQDFETQYQVPPFDKIQNSDFLPAFKKAVEMHKAEIDKIINNEKEASFENTIEALEYSGTKLELIDDIFNNLLSANTNDELQKIAKEIAPIRSAHYDNIYMNEDLFKKVKAVNDKKDELNLNSEQAKLLEKTYKGFIRSGALLQGEEKERLKKINSKLGVLTLEFGENLLAETNDFKLVIDNEDDLSGLPKSVIEAAANTAKENNMEGKWVFTVQKPSLIPFLQYSNKRNLREKMLKAYINRGDNNNENDNKKIIKQMVNLRLEKANLLGFETHSHYILDKNMAKNPEGVFNLINQLWTPALEQAKVELSELQKLSNSLGNNFELEAWDWWYFAEKLRAKKYNLSDSELRPYFSLENVKSGIFDLTNKLYGLKYKKNTELPLYHNDAMVYEVSDESGLIGLLYMDFYPRASKDAGAWMTSYRKQYKTKDGKNVIPIISVVCNFSKPTSDKPALLSFDETETFFHEFGHALHGLLSNCQYESISGTAVARDFVELPSQIMENWASEPKFLKMYAKHYKTGEAIPDEIIKKMEASAKFNTGFAVTEYLSAAFLDMFWHTLKNEFNGKVNEFESSKLDSLGLIDEIIVRYRSTYFAHIFAGGYSSGYYSYVWAEVIEADAFQAFKENGIFDKETAQSFRKNILSQGGTVDETEMFKNFRGREPEIDALLERKGFTKN